MTRPQPPAPQKSPSEIRDSVRAYYDTVGWQKDESGDYWLNTVWRGSGHLRMASDRREWRELRNFPDGGDVFVELSCGANPQRRMAGRFRIHVCSDISLVGLQGARELGLKGARFAATDNCTLPFRDESVDALLCANGLYHVAADFQAVALREMFRVLKPGGVAVISYDNAQCFCVLDCLMSVVSTIARGVKALFPPVENESTAALSKRPTQHYYHLFPRRWFREQLPQRGVVDIRTCQTLSQGFLMRHMKDNWFWRGVDGFFFQLTNDFPHATVPFSCHLTVVLRKPRNA